MPFFKLRTIIAASLIPGAFILKSKYNTPVSCNSNSGHHKKIVYDPIHKVVKLHPLWVDVIDTPEFQRLRYIKQLGCCYFVYPSATHTRFEHSIGVCVLAKRMAETLQKQLGTEYVTDKDVLCVSIAGLCHDLGHGPFSHTWELFMKRVDPDVNWKHEDMSIKIFECIWKDLDSRPVSPWKSHHLDENDRIFIRDLIRGENTQTDNPKYKDKKFLFEIVANKKNGVDVDKWDYFARDAYYVGTNTSFDHERLLHAARALGPNDDRSIHYRNTEIINLYHMFYIRYLMHQRIYKHKVVRIIERMIIDALELGNHDVFKGKKLSDFVKNTEDYIKLNDSIFHLMLELPEQHESRLLIERIQNRDLYKCVGCAVTSRIEKVSEKEIESLVQKTSSLTEDDFYVDIAEFNYGKGGTDPIKSIRIYDKDGNVVTSDCIPSLMLTNTFAEKKISFMSRKNDERTQEAVRKQFETWFKTHERELDLKKSC